MTGTSVYRLSGSLLLLSRAIRRVWPQPAGSFRIVLLHWVLREWEAAFECLLQYLLRTGGIISPEEAEARLCGTSGPTREGRVPYLLTFDDGYASNAVVAKSILRRHAVKALFFVCPDVMDLPRSRQLQAISRQYFEPGTPGALAPPEAALMSWAEVEELAASGHTIGSHGSSHARLSGLTGAEREREIAGSADRLADRLGGPVRWFAFPFGNLESLDEASCRLIVQRYDYCCSGIRGIVSMTADPWALLRESVDLSTSFAYQVCALEGGLDLAYLRKARRLRSLFSGARTHSAARGTM